MIEKAGKKNGASIDSLGGKSSFSTPGGQIYENAIIQKMTLSTIWLEVGCGYKGFPDRIKKKQIKYKFSVGIDIVYEYLDRNESHDSLVVADVEYLPFKQGAFDMVINQWVIEHLPRPRRAFQQINFVLKLNGHLFSLTNNIFHPLMLLSHILPTAVNDYLQGLLLLKEAKQETLPTYYRANSLKRHNRMLTGLGFRKIFCRYADFTQLFSSSKLLLMIFKYYEKITDVKIFNCMKHLLVSNYQKVSHINNKDGRILQYTELT